MRKRVRMYFCLTHKGVIYMSKKKSLYNEEETIRLCKKYGIEMVEKEGGPLFLGEEMDDLFFLDMMDGDGISR